MVLVVGEWHDARGTMLIEEDGETIPLSQLIASLETETIRVRKLLSFNRLGSQTDKVGSQIVLIGMESLLSSIQKLEGEADLTAWFKSQHKPEGLTFYQVKTLIDKHNLKEEVRRCFWNANRGRLPSHRQIPISFAMYLYAEFVLHKHVNYRSVRPGAHNTSTWKILGFAQTPLAYTLDCRSAPTEQSPKNKRNIISSEYLLQESASLIHTPCIEVESSSEKYTTSSVSSTLPVEPCVKEPSGLIYTPTSLSASTSEAKPDLAQKDTRSSLSSPVHIAPCRKKSSTSMCESPAVQHLTSEAKGKASVCLSRPSLIPRVLCTKESSGAVHTPSTLLDIISEVKTGSSCSAVHIAASVKVEDSKTRVHQRLEERELQLSEAKQQNQALAKQLHGIEETRKKLEETTQHLKETRLQLEEQEKLIINLRYQAEVHDREVKEDNYRQQVHERELLEELTSTRIALHSARHVLAYLSPRMFERSTTISLQIVPPSDVFLLNSAFQHEQCGICHTDLKYIRSICTVSHRVLHGWQRARFARLQFLSFCGCLNF
ncbi:hypothetical protein GOP47_0004965 [Adiantum capillus-veneris]|uniref:Uncharacterized protein n=1 Tax=Adiantum capillus-veneris TaxID=13818 RepID=A0A9D4V499_ADICA|nr:hypothetical protein GOP47_0004965 [Adiantum capillus-veneris]